EAFRGRVEGDLRSTPIKRAIAACDAKMKDLVWCQDRSVSGTDRTRDTPVLNRLIDIPAKHAAGYSPVLAVGADCEPCVATGCDENLRERALHEHGVVVGRQPVQAEGFLEVAAREGKRTETLVASTGLSFEVAAEVAGNVSAVWAFAKLMPAAIGRNVRTIP